MSNDFESFSALPEELQREAIREGEVRLQAQLSIATAADQRALTWGGILVAAATGALGGGLALISKDRPDYALGLFALFFAAAMTMSAWAALSTVQPTKFCLPGNLPINWLPAEWGCVGTDGNKMRQARIEQAEQMSRHIKENAENARSRAMKMAKSFTLARRAIWTSGLLLLGTLLWRAAEKQTGQIEVLLRLLLS